MQNTVLGIIAVIIVAAGGWYWYTHQEATTTGSDFGTYAYACDNGVKFDLTLSSDLSSATLKAQSAAPFSEVVLEQKVASTYATEEGEVSFVGAGEEIVLTVGAATMSCNPVPSPDMAPFNWGDAGEPGSIKQDTSLIVTESIRGKWQSVDDPKFVREFKEGDAISDWYDGKAQTSGLWVAFTKDKAPKIFPYPMDDDSVYLQITLTGSQADTLNFKIVKLTPEELQLAYLDRGGVLTFKSME